MLKLSQQPLPTLQPGQSDNGTNWMEKMPGRLSHAGTGDISSPSATVIRGSYSTRDNGPKPGLLLLPLSLQLPGNPPARGFLQGEPLKQGGSR